MFLSKQKLKKIIDQEKLKVNPFSKEDLRMCSIKLHLGEQGYNHNPNEILDVTLNEESNKNSFKLDEDGYIMNPGNFFLIKTKERIAMPEGHLGWMETRGSLAKLGIQTHLCGGHIDPGSDLKITLQLKNVGNNQVRIHPGMYAVKLYISKLSVKL
ncbi:MAG: dCTP deaminase [Candidatus Paceibacteria bacterium]